MTLARHITCYWGNYSPLFIICLAISVLILVPETLFARTRPVTSLPDELPVPDIYGFTIANSRDNLLAYFSLKNGCPPEVQTALGTGISVRYVYELELQSPRFLLKKVLSQRTVIRTITFDNLKEEYQVSFGPDTPRVICVKTLKEAESIAFEINDVAVIPLSRLIKGEMYILRVRAKIEKASSSLPFRNLMEIFSSWGYQTKWHEIQFNY